MMARDKFRDWNLLHKSMVAFVAAVLVGVAVHSYRMIDSAFRFEHAAIIPYAAETVWPWLIDYRDRARWQAELIDISRLSGDADQAGSTRLIFWRRGYRHWSALEQTREILPNRVFASIQESDTDRRWFRIELIPLGPCSTRVVMQETIQPLTYEDRFWFFSNQSARQERLEISTEALGRWLGDTQPECGGQAG